MKRTILQALLGLLLLLCTTLTFAQTFYVDGTKTVNGDGSAASPWNDFRYAVWATPAALAAGANDIGWSDIRQQRLTSGLYIVQLVTAAGRTTFKVMVQ